MPIYEYECVDCGEVFEVFQRMSDPPLQKCQFCKGRVNRLISQCSFQLKGTGWYVTDYKKPVDSTRGNGARRAEKKEEKTETATTTETKSESTGGSSESGG